MISETDLRVSEWRAADFINDKEDVIGYINGLLEQGDDDVLLEALGDIARSEGMTKLARETGITRDGLYKALAASGNPSYSTVRKVFAALGLELRVVPADPAKAQSA
ncbi:addiction module antidote protein [Paratractidigestivibacter sp.]|uniref:addiction module antidote protein n=1 Tax=Paratractidigestivibacter sp. TaxID=2847316 RepID=UPI002ABD5A57|nr:addiction module antidote protein [Paratractidigestivibacter sp.]